MGSHVVQIFARQSQARAMEYTDHAYDARRLIDLKDDSMRFEDNLAQIQAQILSLTQRLGIDSSLWTSWYSPRSQRSAFSGERARM